MGGTYASLRALRAPFSAEVHRTVRRFLRLRQARGGDATMFPTTIHNTLQGLEGVRGNLKRFPPQGIELVNVTLLTSARPCAIIS